MHIIFDDSDNAHIYRIFCYIVGIKIEYFEKGPLSYEIICKSIKSKENVTGGKHFFGLLIALNIFYTSEDLYLDFMKIVNEGRNGKCEFIISKFPKLPSEITEYVIKLRQVLSQSDETKTK